MVQNDKTPPDMEITILATAYTIYCHLTEEPIPESAFYAEYANYGHVFSDFVLGHTEK